MGESLRQPLGHGTDDRDQERNTRSSSMLMHPCLYAILSYLALISSVMRKCGEFPVFAPSGFGIAFAKASSCRLDRILYSQLLCQKPQSLTQNRGRDRMNHERTRPILRITAHQSRRRRSPLEGTSPRRRRTDMLERILLRRKSANASQIHSLTMKDLHQTRSTTTQHLSSTPNLLNIH